MKVVSIAEKKYAIVAKFDDDSTLAIPSDVAAEYDVAVDALFSPEEMILIRERSAEVFAIRYAMRMLARASRSEYQIRFRLKKKGYSDTAVEAAMAHLADIGFLDDTHYAKLLVDHYREKNRSAREIRYRLSNAHIDSDIIDEVLVAGEQKAERAALRGMIERHYGAYAASGEKGLEKLTMFLRRKGFSYSSVKQAIRERMTGEIDD